MPKKNVGNATKIMAAANFKAWEEKSDCELFVFISSKAFPKNAIEAFQNDYRIQWCQEAFNNISIRSVDGGNYLADPVSIWNFAQKNEFHLLLGWGPECVSLPNHALYFDSEDNNEYKAPVCLSPADLRTGSRRWLNMHQKSVRIITDAKLDKDDQAIILKELQRYRVESAELIKLKMPVKGNPENYRCEIINDFTLQLELSNKQLAKEKHDIDISEEDEELLSGEAADHKEVILRPTLWDKDTYDSTIRDYLIKETPLLEDFALDENKEFIFSWDGKKWEFTKDIDYKAYIDSECLTPFFVDGYANSRVNNISEMCRRSLLTMGGYDTERNLINFQNCVLEIFENGTLATHCHSKEFGLTTIADYEYIPGLTDTPYFDKWINHASCDSDGTFSQDRYNTIMAVCYLVITNQYRWQFFIEVIGAGGTGKSIFVDIFEALAGGFKAVAYMSIPALEGTDGKGKGAYQELIGKRALIMAEQAPFYGELENLKRLTGNDPFNIPIMHKPDYVLPCFPGVVLTTANQPIAATDKGSAIERRRITILMDNKVSEEEKIIGMSLLIKKEVPAIFNKVTDYFKEPEDARQALILARGGEDKQKALIKSDVLVNWISENLEPCQGGRAQVGSIIQFNEAMRSYMSERYRRLIDCSKNTLYANYRTWCYANDVSKPVTPRHFTDALLQRLAQLKHLGFSGCEQISPQRQSTVTNIKIKHDSPMFEFLQREL
ncbi:DUF5906 domain-containing protein [Vibrio parahaemolyticus]